MSIVTAASDHFFTLHSSSATDKDVLAALRGLDSIARSGVETETVYRIFEEASCHPTKDIFGDFVHGSFPLDEAAVSRYILRAVSTLALHLSALQSLEHVLLPEPPRPSTKDAAIIEEVPPQELSQGLDVSSTILCCLLHMSSCPPAESILCPVAPWANDSTTKRAQDALMALGHRSVEAAPRGAQAAEGNEVVETMLRHSCIPCMRQLMTLLAREARPGVTAEDHLHEGPDAFQRCTAAYQLLQFALQLHHPVASQCSTPLLPVITAALADPTPFVKRCAAAALSHLAQQATAAALYAHASILKSCIAKAFVGSEGHAWEALLQAGCGISERLDAVNGGAEYKLDMLTCTMEEVKRSDSDEKWQPWLGCLAGGGQSSTKGLLHGIGVEVLCCTSKLMPMLLNRLILANAAETRPICQVLQILNTSGPRRMRAHTDVILLGLHCVKQSLSVKVHVDERSSIVDALDKTEQLFQAEE